SGCTAGGGAPSMGSMWGGAVLTCGAIGQGCTLADSCAPEEMMADGPLCLMKDGTDPCPAGWSSSIAAFTGGTDTRICTPCGCAVTCNGGGVTVYDHNDCTAGDVTINNFGICAAVLGDF